MVALYCPTFSVRRWRFWRYVSVVSRALSPLFLESDVVACTKTTRFAMYLCSSGWKMVQLLEDSARSVSSLLFWYPMTTLSPPDLESCFEPLFTLLFWLLSLNPCFTPPRASSLGVAPSIRFFSRTARSYPPHPPAAHPHPCTTDRPTGTLLRWVCRGSSPASHRP